MIIHMIYSKVQPAAEMQPICWPGDAAPSFILKQEGSEDHIIFIENQWMMEISRVQNPAGSDPMANLLLQGETDEGVSQAICEWSEGLT